MPKVQKKNITFVKPTLTQAKKSKPIEKIAEASPFSSGDSKQNGVIALLKRPDGATIDELIKTTGWQRHSIHGMISGVLKKRLGFNITAKVGERGRVYHITENMDRL